MPYLTHQVSICVSLSSFLKCAIFDLPSIKIISQTTENYSPVLQHVDKATLHRISTQFSRGELGSLLYTADKTSSLTE